MPSNDALTFYGRVKEEDIDRALKQATWKGFLGLILLFFGGLFFILGLLVIAWGFIPYKRLKTLSNDPPRLFLTDTSLSFIEAKKIETFLLSEIQSMDYTDGKIRLFSKEKVDTIPCFSLKTFQELKEVIFSETDESDHD